MPIMKKEFYAWRNNPAFKYKLEHYFPGITWATGAFIVYCVGGIVEI